MYERYNHQTRYKHKPYNNLQRKRWKPPVWIYIVTGIAAIYLSMTFHNARMSDQAFKTVNIFSQHELGYPVLVDKGFLGHSWFYFTHPGNNFSELAWDMDTRVSKFAFEGLGVWNLSDFVAPQETVKAQMDVEQVEPPTYFDVNITEITAESNTLWTDVDITFDFISSPAIDAYRDSTGKLTLNAYMEYSNAEGTICVSNGWSVGILGDNRYYVTLIGDPYITARDIVSVTFEIGNSGIYCRKYID